MSNQKEYYQRYSVNVCEWEGNLSHELSALYNVCEQEGNLSRELSAL